MEGQYWLIAPGENARKWDEYSKNGEIGIGWEELGNIEKYGSDYESFQNDYIKTYKSENDNYKGSSPKQIWDFYKNISIGDIIFARNGVFQIVGMGKVKSDYIYDDSRDEYKQIRKVEWEKIGEWDYPGQSSRDTVHRLKPEQAKEIIKIMSDEPLVKKYASLLKNTKNLILTGAPGTGKTYLAKQIAKELGCEDDNIGFVQFHPSYDYTDFVEGLRPTDKDGNGNVGFERRDGVFKEFCAKALKNLVDSRKSVDVLQHERTINEIVEDFLNDAVEKKTQFETHTK
ncbi:MAG: AAA family ATPase, partial [Treponema bryantii]|nr:AAA family ATPase [Treponema bryantii]